MRWALVAVFLMTTHVCGCGRYGYDYLARGDEVGGSADGGDGDGTGDGDGDVAPGDGDGDGDADGGSLDGSTGSNGQPDFLDGAIADADGGVGSPGGDGGASMPDPSLAACTAPVGPNAPLPKHRYEFARTDSLAADSISLRDGSLTGATQTGGMAELSGSAGSYVQLPSGLISSLSSVTIMIWVRWDSGPQNQTILDFGQSASNRLQLLASIPGNGVTARFVTANSSISVSTTQFLTIGTTHQVIIELAPAEQRMTLSIDGSPKQSSTGTAFSLADLRDDNLYIGRTNGSEQAFVGGIEELRIYDRALGVCANLLSSKAGFASTTFARCADPQSSCGFASTVAGFFWVCDEAVSFSVASDRCANAGMKLATADGSSKNQLLATASSLDIMWIGLNDRNQEGTFAWCDGELLSYQNWAAGEPNDNGALEDCGSLIKADGTWNDLRCSELHGFLCEP